MSDQQLVQNTRLQEFFAQLAQEYDTKDQIREQTIKSSRDILKCAKQAIYALHKDDKDRANELLAQAKQHIASITALQEETIDSGAFRASLEEYLEAKAYLFVLETGTFPTYDELTTPEANTETYLQALSDCSGELVRKAVQAATQKDISTVKQLAGLVEELQGLFLQFDFRNGELRKKSDMLRHNAHKIQTIIYEVSLRFEN